MVSTLIDSLSAYDPTRPTTRSVIESGLASVAEGSLYDKVVRATFWDNIPHDRVTSVLSSLIDVYLAHRRYYIRRLDSSAHDSDIFGGHGFQFHVQIMMLLQDAGDVVAGCLDAIGEMVLDDDQELYFVACKMLAGSSCEHFIPSSTAIAALSKWGVCEYPFSLGTAVEKASNHDALIVPALLDAMPNDRNVAHSVLTINHRLSIDENEKCRIACQHAAGEDAQLACAAIQALGEIGMNSRQANEIIVTALDSEHYYMRANAAEAAGKLHVNPDATIPKLIEMLSNEDGCDYTPREGAIRGLGGYGRMAASAIPALTALRQALLEDGCDTEDLRDLDAAIAAINAT